MTPMIQCQFTSCEKGWFRDHQWVTELPLELPAETTKAELTLTEPTSRWVAPLSSTVASREFWIAAGDLKVQIAVDSQLPVALAQLCSVGQRECINQNRHNENLCTNRSSSIVRLLPVGRIMDFEQGQF